MTSMRPHIRPLTLLIAVALGIVKALTWLFVGLFGFVGPVGLEPTTRGLKVRCSAN